MGELARQNREFREQTHQEQIPAQVKRVKMPDTNQKSADMIFVYSESVPCV